MKSVLLIVILGFACANAQDVGIDFVIDNIVKPTVGDLVSGVGNYLVSSLAGWLTGLFGKRDLNVPQVISQVQSLVNNYKDKIEQIISLFSNQIQGLFNIFNLAGPARSHVRVEYVHKIGDYQNLVKQETLNFLNSLFQIFQQIFGQNFASLFGSNGRTVFGNVSSVLNNLSNSINQVLENYGDSLLATALNISQLTLPLLGNFQQQLTNNANSVFQHVQQIINQLQN